MQIRLWLVATAVAVSTSLVPRMTGAFTLIEKLVPVTVEATLDQAFKIDYFAWGGFTDAQETQFVGGVELLPAVQKLHDNLVVTVPRVTYGFATSILLCDGSVSVAFGLNNASANSALGPPAQSFNQFFASTGVAAPSEAVLVRDFVDGNKTALLNFYHEFLGRIGSPLTTATPVIEFSTAARVGTQEDVERPQGDANFDGTVNFTDLLTLAQHYGMSPDATWEQGDFNGNGKVGFDDLLILAQNYGQTIKPAGAAAVVPEPALAGALLGSSAVLMLRRRR